MLNMLWVSLRISFATILLTGILYPFAVTGICELIMPLRTNGSFLKDDQGRFIGSRLIGQAFTSDFYFHGRPSAAGKGYDALASGGSNFGPTSLALRTRVLEDMRKLHIQNPAVIPSDLVTASASGLDPHISPQAAHWQAGRVAKSRGVDLSRVQGLIQLAIEGPQFKILGSYKINVLKLNVALDQHFGSQSFKE